MYRYMLFPGALLAYIASFLIVASRGMFGIAGLLYIAGFLFTLLSLMSIEGELREYVVHVWVGAAAVGLISGVNMLGLAFGLPAMALLMAATWLKMER